MINSGTEPGWLSVAEASRVLGISETAVRKRIRVGHLRARDHQGRKEVHVEVGNFEASGYQLAGSTEFGLEAARMAGELAELRARFADVQQDRDRWHQLAVESRNEARVAEAERAALERELRLLLART